MKLVMEMVLGKMEMMEMMGKMEMIGKIVMMGLLLRK